MHTSGELAKWNKPGWAKFKFKYFFFCTSHGCIHLLNWAELSVNIMYICWAYSPAELHWVRLGIFSHSLDYVCTLKCLYHYYICVSLCQSENIRLTFWCSSFFSCVSFLYLYMPRSLDILDEFVWCYQLCIAKDVNDCWMTDVIVKWSIIWECIPHLTDWAVLLSVCLLCIINPCCSRLLRYCTGLTNSYTIVGYTQPRIKNTDITRRICYN